jgi:hypothetical protein
MKNKNMIRHGKYGKDTEKLGKKMAGLSEMNAPETSTSGGRRGVRRRQKE